MSRFFPVKVLLIAAMLVAAAAAPVQARPAEEPQLGVFAITDRLARQIAVHGNPQASLPAQSSRLTAAINAANKDVLAAKGLPANGGSVLRIRLADPAMNAALALGATPLVAATPTDDTAEAIVAYDPTGKAVFLDAAKVPQRPVYLVEVDVAKAMPLGISVIERKLGTRAVAPTAAGYWATKVNAVRLSDDEEPWFKGGAEVYSIVGGFGLDGHPAVNVVQMPYLDHDLLPEPAPGPLLGLQVQPRRRGDDGGRRGHQLSAAGDSNRQRSADHRRRRGVCASGKCDPVGDPGLVVD